MRSQQKLGDDDRYQIGYTVLSSQSSNPDDDSIWTDFVALPFPRELRPIGRGLIMIDFEADPIPTADVAFEVVSDDSYVYVFRQSVDRTLYVDRFVFDEVAGRLICGLCGCVAAKKARLPHEACPGPDPRDPTQTRWGEPR